ncbi:hypothetical protein ACQEVB_22995 [Pseudonocardia sp. CA-107938]|uniref:hypothetical protein n=1 Tax=Pseudonocardia sp. CA-107938 TaxID=3240021 RepID=UPI003D8A5918
MTPEEERWRAEFRAFVRDHHPDRGGDPDAFVAGMARFAETRPVPGASPTEDLDPRYDRPVEFTTPYPLPLRVAIALIRTVRKQRAARTLD